MIKYFYEHPITAQIQLSCFYSIDTPLSLLTETVRSMLALSDLFCEHSQFRWMFDHFNEIQKTHPIEDEMLTNLLRIGICKAIAVLGKYSLSSYFVLERALRALASSSGEAACPGGTRGQSRGSSQGVIPR